MNNFTNLLRKAQDVSPGRDLIPGFSSAGGVGAALLTKEGNYYTGINLDFSCSLGFCAEHSAIADMLKHGEEIIVEIIAVGQDGIILPPCGRCREMMLQVSRENKDTLVHLSGEMAVTLGTLLPDHWIDHCVVSPAPLAD